MTPEAHLVADWMTTVSNLGWWALALAAIVLSVQRRNAWLALAAVSFLVFPSDVYGYTQFFLLRLATPVLLTLAVVTEAEP